MKPKNIPAPPTALIKLTNMNLKNVFFRIRYSPYIHDRPLKRWRQGEVKTDQWGKFSLANTCLRGDRRETYNYKDEFY